MLIANNTFAQILPTDCVNSITVCGNGSFISNASGIGNTREVLGCGSIEHNTIWLKINVVQAGTLGFDLIPIDTSITVDYDFWVFGPNKPCSNLGNAIRCSTSNPSQSNSTNNHTGMDLSTNATTSLWNNCCGYVRSLNVLPGETYYIAVDRPHGYGGFVLNWLWTPTIAGTLPFSPPPIANRIPDYRTCSVTPNSGIFNLNSVKSQINPDLINNTITFYATFANAVDKISPLPIIGGNSGNPQTIYARVTNNVTGCYSITDFKLVVLPIPTAAISVSNQQICAGDNVVTTFTGSPDAKIEYTINGGTVQTAILNSSGIFSITQAPSTDVTYNLLNVQGLDSAGNTICFEPINSAVKVTLNSIPTATLSGATTICSGNATKVTFNGTPGATVNYLDNSGNPQAVVLDSAGTNSITTPLLTSNATYTLVNVISSGANPCTKKLTDSIAITVNSLPTATLSGATTICSGNATKITFNGTPGATVNYLDNLGNPQSVVLDSAGTSSVTTPSLIATSTYTLVNVIASGANPCTKILSDSVTVNVISLPTASLSGATTICSGTTTQITFNGTPGATVNYLDNSGNSQAVILDSAGTNFITTPSLTANATYTLVNVIASGANPCTKILSDSVKVTVNPIPTATLSGASTICSGNTSQITFNGTPGATVNYLDNSGNPQSIVLDSAGTNFILTPSLTANAIYTLVNVISSGANPCTKILSDSFKVTVNSIPTATLSGATTICSGNTTQITFNGTPGATVNYLDNSGNPQSVQLDLMGKNSITTAALTANATFTLVNVISSGANPCTKILSDSVTISVISLPSATLSGATTICSGNTAQITFNGTPGATVNYLDNSGNPQAIVLDSAGTNSITTPSLTTDATYTLVNVISNGTNPCTKKLTDSVKVTVNAIPTARLSGTTTICSGNTSKISFNGTPGATVNYLDNSGNPQSVVLDSAGTNFITTPLLTANATYTLVNVITSGANPCTKILSDSVTVTVISLPTASLSGATTICSGTTTQITFNGTTGATVNYLDNSGNPQAIVLDSAGTNSITTPPLTANATYTLVNVTLLGVNPCIKSLSDSIKVTVISLPTAAISGATTICNGSSTTISFSGTPNATVTYTVNGGANQIVILDNLGVGSVSTGNLTATTTYQLVSISSAGLPACTQVQSDSVVVTVVPIPQVKSVVSSTNVCSGQPISISLSSNAATATFNWIINPSGVSGASAGSGNKISQNLTATNTTPGLVIYNITASEGACQGPVTPIIISVNPIPVLTPSTVFQSICSGSVSPIQLTSNVAGTVFDWNVVMNNVTGASNGTGSTISQIVTTQDNNVGEAVYSVIPTAGSCSGIPMLITVKVNPIPMATANAAATTICSSSTTNIALTSTVAGTTFSWTVIQTGIFGASSDTGNSIAQTLATVGTIPGSVRYTITPSINGCFGVPRIVNITVNPTPEVFGSTTTTICSGESPNISLFPSLAATTFAWTVNPINVTGAQAGTGVIINDILTASSNLGTAIYSVTPTTNGCSGTPLNITVKVNPSPVYQINDGVICVDQVNSVSYQNYILDTNLSNASYDFVWYFNGVIINGATKNTYEATQAGTYSVIVTDTATGCKSVMTQAVVTASFPGTVITTTETLAFSDNATITADVSPINTIYEYSLDNGPLQSSNVFTNVSPGPHIVSVTDENGCTNLTKLVTIIGYLTFFTPNGDNYHDTWNIVGLGADAKVFIFDRYGKLIKQISPTGEGWDGTLNGEPLLATDYWFTVDYSEPQTGESKTFRSHFSLKR
jgi:gliding motility-associated-like protein